MNKRGFTLVELLAVLVVLSLVMGISIVGITSSIKNAKQKAEKEFLSQLSNSVDAYIELCLSHMELYSDSCSVLRGKSLIRKSGIINKRKDTNEGGIEENQRTVQVYIYGAPIYFDNLISENILSDSDMVNPVTRTSCKTSQSSFYVYYDEDFVYYYDMDIDSKCLQYNASDNPEVSTLPSGYISTILGHGNESLPSGRTSGNSADVDKESTIGKNSNSTYEEKYK